MHTVCIKHKIDKGFVYLDIDSPPGYLHYKRKKKSAFLSSFYKFVHSVPDLKDTESYDKIVEIVASKVGDSGLNVLFNNAGVTTKFTRLSLVKAEQMSEVFLVNTIAPVMLTKVRVKISNSKISEWPNLQVSPQ